MNTAAFRTALLLGTFVSGCLSAQNVVLAPDFDSATITPPWTPNDATIAFDGTRNAVGAPGSGSIVVTNTAANGLAASAFECIDQPFAPGPYDFGGWMLFPPGQPGVAEVAIIFYSSAGCGGSSAGVASVSIASASSWTLSTGVIDAPSNVLSASVDLRIDTPIGASPPVQGWFDGIRLGPVPTMPVELQSFFVD